MSFESITPSQAEQHKAWKEARVRLRAPETVDKLRVSHLALVPTEPPPVRDPVSDLMDFVVAAVGNVAGLPVNEIIAGPPIAEVRNARNLALGLCVARLGLDYRTVIGHFGVQKAAIRSAERRVRTILETFTISNFTPLEIVLPTIWGQWGKEPNRPTVHEILDAVSERWGVSKHDIKSLRRTKNLVRPRHAVFALAKRLTLRSLPEIGQAVGDRDHTSVLYGINRYAPVIEAIEGKMLQNSTVADWADSVFRQLKDTPLAYVKPRGKRV